MKAQIAIMMKDIEHDLDLAESSIIGLKKEIRELSAFLYDPKNVEAEQLICEYTKNCCHFRAKIHKLNIDKRFVKVG